MNNTLTVNVAVDREDHPEMPYVWWDDTPGITPGWVLRHMEYGQEMDSALIAADRDAPDAAVTEAVEYLTGTE